MLLTTEITEYPEKSDTPVKIESFFILRVLCLRPMLTSAHARVQGVHSVANVLSVSKNFSCFYQRVPVRGESLHPLVRQVVADIKGLPRLREVELAKGYRLQPFCVIVVFIAGDG